MQTVVPNDAADVMNALRLGWAVAELRGRFRRRLESPVTGTASLSPIDDSPLPLESERTPMERLIQVEAEVTGLSRQLQLDFPCSRLPLETPAQDATASQAVTALCKQVAGATSDDQKHTSWEQFTRLVYAWDAKIQDYLSAGSPTMAAAYGMGRGIAEIYWVLDPTDGSDGSHGTWAYLLGPSRRGALTRYLVELGRYFDPAVVSAVPTSLEAWGRLAADPTWRAQTNAYAQLYEQLQLWRNLFMGAVDVHGLVSTSEILRRHRRMNLFLKAFAYEAITYVVGLALAVGAVILLSLSPGDRRVGAVLATLSLFGITGASLIVRTRGIAMGLFEQLRAAMNNELIAVAITLCPAKETVLKVEDARG